MHLHMGGNRGHYCVPAKRRPRVHPTPQFPCNCHWGRDQTSRPAPSTGAGTCSLLLTIPPWNWDRIKGWGFPLKILAGVV